MGGNMNRDQALAYGRAIGCTYYVYTVSGYLYGGYKTLKAAEDAKSRFEREDRDNPWTNGKTQFVIKTAK